MSPIMAIVEYSADATMEYKSATPEIVNVDADASAQIQVLVSSPEVIIYEMG